MPPRLTISGRPQPGEYAAYAQRDIDQVAGDCAVTALRRQRAETAEQFRRFGERGGSIAYAHGKWTVKQVLGHLADDERIFAYRALCVARGDTRPLPGFDENAYAAAARFDEQPLAELLADYLAVRDASLTLFAALDRDAWLRQGTVNDYPASTRGLAFHIAGHELHHLRILVERYLPLLEPSASGVVLIDAPEARIQLDVPGYQYPTAPADDCDSDWVRISMRVQCPRGRWKFVEPCLTDGELKELASWLRGFPAAGPGDYIDFTQPNLRFDRVELPTGDALKISFSHEAAPPWATEEERLGDGCALYLPIASIRWEEPAAAIEGLYRKLIEQARRRVGRRLRTRPPLRARPHLAGKRDSNLRDAFPSYNA